MVISYGAGGVEKPADAGRKAGQTGRFQRFRLQNRAVPKKRRFENAFSGQPRGAWKGPRRGQETPAAALVFLLAGRTGQSDALLGDKLPGAGGSVAVLHVGHVPDGVAHLVKGDVAGHAVILHAGQGQQHGVGIGGARLL